MRMLMKITAIGLALAASLSAAKTTCAQSLHLPPHEKIVLKNGLTVLLLEKHGVPLLNATAIVKAGSLADPAGQEGLASITAGLLRKGTKTRTSRQFSDEIDFIGGQFEAEARADYTSVNAEFLTKDAGRGLDLVADALVHPTFPAEETKKLLAQSVDGIKAAKDSAQGVIFEYYEGYLYDGKGYGRPTGGDEVSLKKIRREAVAKFYEAYYTPGNTILAIAGDFNSAEIKRTVEEKFGGWPARTAPAIKAEAAAPVRGKRLLLVNKADATQTFFTVGNVATTATDPDRVAIRVVNTVFGERFTSLLNEALRVESGLTYGAQSFFVAEKQPGPFAMFSYTRNETTAQAMDLMLETLRKLHSEGLTAEQLASAKNYIKGQYPPTIETSRQLARLIASHEFYGLTDDEVNGLEARMNAVTLQTAKQIIDKHFPMDNLVFTVVGKADAIGPAMKKYAEKQDQKEITEEGFWDGKGKEARK